MEDLVKELNNLKLTSSITGILYDNDTLLHKPDFKYPEIPERVSSIITHLAKSRLLTNPNIEVINKLPKVSRQ